MSPFPHPRSIFIAAVLGMAGACLGLPVAASQAVAVTFQAGNPWTQEVGSVSHEDASHDYTVTAEAGKTLQVNLVSRDPNIFFTVKNQDDRNALVDTMKTGATTWSTQNAAAATYTIRVYVQPEAMPRGSVSKYALQIGQYGAQDLQPATTEVAFQPNNPWAQMTGSVNAEATSHDFTVALDAGKTLQVNLISQNTNLHFKVDDLSSNKTLVDTAEAGTNTWSAPVASATNFRIRVYIDPAAVPPGTSAQYALQVGQYASAAPAAAGTAAQPATPATAASAPAPASTAGANG
ncbi:MAG: hypothetical protein J0H27_07435 [Xanthomonadales bacterium]|nr:hypothetical protein [Xanthomonadales bacterium]